jgi:hypothetical protein
MITLTTAINARYALIGRGSLHFMGKGFLYSAIRSVGCTRIPLRSALGEVDSLRSIVPFRGIGAMTL